MYGIAIFCVFVSILCSCIYIIDKKQITRDSFTKRIGAESPEEVLENNQVEFEEAVFNAMIKLRKKLSPYLPGLDSGEYDEKLLLAGRPYGISGAEFYILKICCALIPPLLIPFLAILGSSGVLMILMLVGGIVGFLAPDAWLNSTIEKRQKSIHKELFAFLDILVICTESGLTIVEAIRKTVNYQKGFLSSEFAYSLKEIEAGKKLEDAIGGLIERTDVEDLEKVLYALNQSIKRGTSIAGVLKEQVTLMRDLRRNKAQEITQKAKVKISIPVVVCTVIPMLIILIGPAAMNMMQSL